MAIKLRRSVLFLPGINERATEKARTLPIDCVILDLEDAVAEEKKIAAREQVSLSLDKGGFGTREVIVRINKVSSIWVEGDLDMLKTRHPSAILIPKIDSIKDLHQIREKMAFRGFLGEVPLWGMIESARGVLNIASIANEMEEGSALVLGTNDLAKNMQVKGGADRLPFGVAFSMLIMAARAYGLSAIDGIYADLENKEGFHAECIEGMRFGFDGKTLIHPNQVDFCNACFSPSEEDISRAQCIIKAYKKGLKEGKGVIRFEGRMIEALHVDEAKRILALGSQSKIKPI
ncbi:MAG: HpcH/HpaI aldolase/citrate lyase family protein [Sphingomonadales bacterium]